MEAKQSLKVLGIVGSLRAGSYNRALLRAAQELAPDTMHIDIFENEILAQIPLYNEDVRQRGEPEAVVAIKQMIRDADGLILVTPEYLHSVSGVLKNALDWASRPPMDSPLDGKPVAIMGASTSFFGTARAQMHLREICTICNMHVLKRPEVLVSRAAEKFDEQGKLVDEDGRKFIAQQLEDFAAWINRFIR